MCKADCFDLDGNLINHFTQWDINQEILITGASFDSKTEVHFCNEKSTEALWIAHEVIDSSTIKVSVPNSLLIEPLVIMIYVYCRIGDSGRTVLTTRIPVRAKKKPQSFIYKDNVEFVRLVNLIDEVNQLNQTISDAENIRMVNENTRQTQYESLVESMNAVSDDIQKRADEGEFSATLSINDVITGDPGTMASVENIGDEQNVVLNITIPRGDTGVVENISQRTIDFAATEVLENIVSGESLDVLFSKIQYYLDALTNKYNDLSTQINDIKTNGLYNINYDDSTGDLTIE